LALANAGAIGGARVKSGAHNFRAAESPPEGVRRALVFRIAQ
jgi:hypothetical protein